MKLILPRSRAFYDDDDDDDDDFGYEEEKRDQFGKIDQQDDDTDEQEPKSTVRYQPVWTGLVTEDGRPIVKHPVIMRMGFHSEEDKLYLPTLEDDDGPILGWTYGVL